MWFATAAMTQLGHCLSIRGVRAQAWDLIRNMRIYFACLSSVAMILFIIYVPGVQVVFLARPFPPGYWVGVFLAAMITFFACEMKKAVMISVQGKPSRGTAAMIV